MKKKYLSLWLVAGISVLMMGFRFLIPFDNILSWDVFGYYLYLPARFIYHDLSLQDQGWLTTLIEKYEPTATLYQAGLLPNGNWVMKYTLGLAILYAPFYFIAHLIASLGGFPIDGLSAPYQYTIAAGGILYAIAGLLIFRIVLKKFFDEKVTCIILFIIVFGTNYFQLTTFDGTLLSHNFLFTLYALLLWLTIRWHEKPHWISAAGIGLVCGLMTLIRPSEILCVLLPLLWNTGTKSARREKLALIKQHGMQVLLIVLCFFLALLPQILYWKSVTGSFLYYSYTNPGEGFEFLWPYTLKFLFSFRKGWIIYTPLMLFAIAGFVHLYRHKREIFPAIFLIFMLSIYIISSWSCWWYAGASYSSRSLVPIYVLLSLPLGYLIKDLLQRKVSKIIAGVVIVLLLVLNLFQTWQFEQDILPRDNITAAYYCAVFGKTTVSPDDKKFLMVERSTDGIDRFTDTTGYLAVDLCNYTFEENSDSTQPVHSGRGSLHMNEAMQFSPGPDVAFRDLTNGDHAWIRAGAWIYIPDSYTEELPLLVITFHHKGGTYKYQATALSNDRLKLNDWNYLSTDYLTPEVRSKWDNMKVYIWHRGKGELFVDDFRVRVYNRK